MKIFIPTKDRPATILVPAAFEGFRPYIVVHNWQQMEKYVAGNCVPVEDIIISGACADTFGLTRQREWVLNNLVQPNEWICFADDNIRWVEGLPAPHYYSADIELPHKCSKEWRQAYRTPVTPERFEAIFNEMVGYAEVLGAKLCGFGTNDNYYFRRKHWSLHKYVIGKLMFVKNVGIPYDHTISMEDMRMTAEHLLRYGKVLVNNYVRPEAGHYESGGMGTYIERIPQRRLDCVKLMSMFPGLFRYRKPGKMKGAVEDADLAFRLHTSKQIANWRATMRTPVNCAVKRMSV